MIDRTIKSLFFTRNTADSALIFTIVLSALGAHACSDDDKSSVGLLLAGGDTTVYDTTNMAFGLPAPNLVGERLARHLAGDRSFEAQFVAAPAIVNGGLGPVFNNVSCISCHTGDGRGRAPHPGESADSMFLKISIPGTASNATGAPNPVPGFGTQLFDKAVFGTKAHGRFMITYAEESGSFDDGESYSLRKPSYQIVDTYQKLPDEVLISPRVAPSVFGRGLLEALAESTILANVDEFDQNGDGISGRANYVWDALANRTVLGRFGLKANNPSLLQQAAGAYNGDMGVTTPYFPTESTAASPQHDTTQEDPEVNDETLQNVAFYTQTLGVPARRNLGSSKAAHGENLFDKVGCASCHSPTMRTGILNGVPEVSNQLIHAYTDMLLHDMGKGLADGRADFLADGNEWRTPPLWGLGLTEVVNGHSFLLHDGRARSIVESILWHDGESSQSRDKFKRLSKADREDLLEFLRSL